MSHCSRGWADPLSPVTIVEWAGLVSDIGKEWQVCPSQVITCQRLLLVGYRDGWFENQINRELV